MKLIQDRIEPLNVILPIQGRNPVRTTKPDHFHMTESIFYIPCQDEQVLRL